jgi:hypothetical protein
MSFPEPHRFSVMSRLSPLILLASLTLLAVAAVAQNVVLAPTTTAISSTGGTVTFTATITYTGTPSVLAFSTNLPTGWSYVSGNNEPPVKPAAGTTGELRWVYTTSVPSSAATFTFTVNYPAGLTGLQPLTTQSVTSATVDAAPVTTAGPTVVIQAPPTAFTWVGTGAGNTGNWTDASQWNPTGTAPNNTGLATHTAQLSAGTAQISTGTTITLNDLLLLGGTVSGGGVLNLLGTGSSWTSGALHALNQVRIASGATLTASTYAPHDFDQTTILNQGTFSWQQGGALRSGNGGAFINAAGAKFIDASSGTVQDYLITNGFSGSFSFSNAGTYIKSTVNSTTRIEVPFTNSGNLLIDGGTLRFTSSFTQSGGNIRLASGTTAIFDNGVSLNGGSLIGNGSITGNVVNGSSGTTVAQAPGFAAITIIETATISPGDTLGRLTITGNLSLLETSKLLIDLGGTTQGVTYDFLSVSGDTQLGGNLAINLQNGFAASVTPGTTFTVVTAANLTGAFANVPISGTRLLTKDGVSSFLVNYTANSVTLTNFVPIPEPSTWALLIAGLGALALSAWRKSRT